MLAAGVQGAVVPCQWDEPSVVERMHEHGLAAGGGSASNFVAVERLVRFGADFVDSNSPATALAALRRLEADSHYPPAILFLHEAHLFPGYSVTEITLALP